MSYRIPTANTISMNFRGGYVVPTGNSVTFNIIEFNGQGGNYFSNNRRRTIIIN